jgi:hypothetical protein
MRAAVLAVFLASCAEEPLYDGRFCTVEAPCPGGFSCVVGTCRRECAVNDECVVEGEVCVSGHCTALTGTTDAGTLQKDGGVDDASLPDAEPVECTDASDCQSPGACETTSASCDQGRCVYARVSCLEPPSAECAGNDTLYQTYSDIGACNDATGQCEYTAMGVPCADCTATCLTPCASVSCDENNGGCRTSGFCMPGQLGEPPQCLYDDADDGTQCSTDEVPSGVCRAGECVECLEDAHCNLDLCTTGVCETNGTCSFTPIALDCSNAPECHQSPGSCDPATGGCVFAPESGASCDDGNECTQTDTCSNGTCGGADPIACRTPPGQCYEITGTCEPSDGSCNYPPSANTRACDDSNACTHTDRCNGAGGCNGVAYSCNDSNACTSDACNGTGGCTNVRIAPPSLAPSGGAVVGTMDVTLTWGACAGSVTYEIEIDWQRADLTWADYFTYTNEPTNSKTFYPCSNAAPGRPCNSDFRFRVRAHDGSAFGPWSPFAIWHWNNCRLC